MQELTARLQQLSSAEDFMQFFGLAYDARVVHVNRLHILKRWRQYLQREGEVAGEGEIDTFRRYRDLLGRAYADFTTSTAQREKVFKVFQDADGAHIGLDTLRDSLAARRGAHAAHASHTSAAAASTSAMAA